MCLDYLLRQLSFKGLKKEYIDLSFRYFLPQFPKDYLIESPLSYHFLLLHKRLK